MDSVAQHDIRSLNAFFSEQIKNKYIDKALRVIKDDVYFVFLGDYVDRGCNSCELLYSLMQFKIQNPDKVILLRGNHENRGLNIEYGFHKEIFYKYEHEFCNVVELISKFYILLPVALYIESGEGVSR